MINEPTRVLLAGDTHGNLPHVLHLLDVARAKDCEAIVQVGDFGFWEHETSGVRFLDDVAAEARTFGIPVIALDGNHDKTSLVLEKYAHDRDEAGFLRVRGDHLLYAPRGHRWTWSGCRLMALGGAYSVDKAYRLHLESERQVLDEMRDERRLNYGGRPRRATSRAGTLWFPEEELTDAELGAALTDPTPLDVLLTHDKPRAANPQWNRKDLPECWPNQDRIQKAVTALRPKLLVHGHLHWRYRDTIRVGDDDQWCQVEGLGGDPSADEHGGYDPADSWMVLDLAEYKGVDAP